MKTNFLNSIIAILIITIIIPGITPNIVSAVDEQVGGNGNSGSGNSSSENLSVRSPSDESTSADISNTDSSNTNKEGSENTNSDKLKNGSSSNDSSSDENSGTGSSNSDKSSDESSSTESSSTAISDTDSSSSSNSGNDISGNDISGTGSSDSDKSSDDSPSKLSDESPSTDSSSTASSDTKSSNSGKSDNDISITGSSDNDISTSGSSSAGSLSIVKSCNGKSITDKSSGRSSIIESSFKIISPEIYFPIVIVNGITNSKSSNSGSSDVRKSTTDAESTVCSPADKACSVSSHTDKASKKCPKTAESKGAENQDFSSDSSGMNYNNSSGMNYNDTDNMSYFYYIYYTSEGIYIIYSDGSYVFYPGSSPLEAVMNLYLTGDTVIEPEENIYAKEHVTRNIISGNPVRFDFVENTTCITYAEFEPLKTFRKTTATAEMLKCLSFFVPEAPAGRIYQCPEILIGNRGAGLSTSFKNGLVGFKVEKTWIKDNNVDKSRITLKWYNSNWEALPTKKVGEDNDYVYFESKTPGFSFFAIAEETGIMNTS